MRAVAIETKAPIVFFAYNRPEHTKRALESLHLNEGADKSELYIFCDGPKTSEDEKNVKLVRTIVKSRQWCRKATVVECDVNQGLAASIIGGVTETVSRFGRVIVLEDDLILSPHFLNYMNDALTIYQEIPNVMHIAGYMFPVRAKLPETFFFRSASCWGWATWKRAWDKFEPDTVKLLDALSGTEAQRRFNIEGSVNFYDMLKAQSEGALDSWAIRWYASVFLNDGLSLHPGRSLVENIGHDSSGTHCSATDIFCVKLRRKRVRNFARSIAEDNKTIEEIVDFFRCPERPLSFNERLKRQLKRALALGER